MRSLIPILLSLALMFILGCGTYRGMGEYRSGNKGYQAGGGGFRTSSDYVQDPETREYLLSRKPSDKILNYRPQGKFKLSWPVKQVKINRGFAPDSDTNHQGVDLGGRKADPVVSAHEGIVIYAGRHFRGYGNMVLVEYDNEWATLYAHLDRFSVTEGQVVQPGDALGSMGDTGHASGVHLHFELLHNRQPIDPLPSLGYRPKFAFR